MLKCLDLCGWQARSALLRRRPPRSFPASTTRDPPTGYYVDRSSRLLVAQALCGHARPKSEHPWLFFSLPQGKAPPSIKSRRFQDKEANFRFMKIELQVIRL